MPDALLWLMPAGGLLSLYIFGRYHLGEVVRGWSFLLSPELRQSIRALEDQVALDENMLDHALEGAERARREACTGEALRLLELALSVVEQAVPDRLVRLRAMNVCCRMAAAMVPLPPLRPRAFQLRQLATLAGLGAVLHHLLVSGHERFRLRLGLLRLGFNAVLGVMGRSAHRARLPLAASASWREFAAARDDFKVLDREHVASFSALLASLAAHPR